MITLIYGGSASGKSSFAEQHAVTCSAKGPRYYIATMKVYGEDGARRVERHVKLRKGKGFHTIECPVDIDSCLEQIPDPSRSTILIECVSNLAANEMFDNGLSKERVTRKITAQIREVCRIAEHCVIVTNNIFEDGVNYENETADYIQCLGDINRQLAQLADEVIEVAAGVPCVLAGSSDGLPGSCVKNAESTFPEEIKDPQMKKGGRRAMQLVIGGRAQGKKDYVIRQVQSRNLTYSVIDEHGPGLHDIPPETQVLILDHLHLLIRRLGAEEPARACLRQIMDQCQAAGMELIIICDETGNGVVPLTKEERDYREHVGRIVCSLAQEASSVEKITCGLPWKLL